MSAQTPRAGPSPRSLTLGLGLLVLGVGLITMESLPTGVWHDDGVYVLQGRALADGDGLRYQGALGAYAAPKFPPAYPVVVAATLELVPNATVDSTAFAVLNVVLLALAAMLLGAWAGRTLGAPPRLVHVAVGGAMLPWAIWSVAQVALSESLFLCTIALALYAGQRITDASASSRWLLLFLAAAALAFFARTIGVVLPVAACVALWSLQRRRTALAIAVTSAAWVVPWAVWSGRVTRAMPGPLQDVLGAYGSWWTAQVGAAPGAYARHLVGNTTSVGRDLVGLVLPGVGGAVWTLLAFVIVGIAGIGLRQLWRRDRLAVLLLLGYLMMVWAWPFRSARLLAPIAPLWMLVVFSGAGVVVVRSFQRSGWWGGVAVSVLLGSVVLNLSGLIDGRHREGLEMRARSLARAVDLVRAHTPAGAVIGAPEYWGALTLHTDAEGVPSARFLPLQQGAPSWGSHQQQFEVWDAAGVDYLLLEQAGNIHGPALNDLEAQCPGAVRTVAVEPGLILAGLAWDEACRELVLPSR